MILWCIAVLNGYFVKGVVGIGGTPAVNGQLY